MPLLNVRLPTYSVDVVGVYDDNFNQVFAEARPMKASIGETSKLMEHPLETGSTIIDNKIINPTEIELSMILNSENFRSTYQQIRQIYIQGRLLTVQTKAASYQNMVIYELPREEDPEMFDAVMLGVKLREAMFVTAKFGTLPASKVKNKGNSSTVDKGEQQAKSVTDGSVLVKVLDGISGAVRGGRP